MTTTDTEFLTRPPVDGNETETLTGSLERMRRTFAWKCGGLDAEATRRTLGPGIVTLGGLLKHMALVEDDLHRKIQGDRPFSPPFEKSASSCGHRRGLSLTIAMDRANYLPRSRGSAPLGRWLVESRFRVRQGKTPPLGAGTLFPNGSWKKSRRRAHPMIELPSGECSPGSVPLRSVTPWRCRARRPGYRFCLRMTFATAMPR